MRKVLLSPLRKLRNAILGVWYAHSPFQQGAGISHFLSIFAQRLRWVMAFYAVMTLCLDPSVVISVFFRAFMPSWSRYASFSQRLSFLLLAWLPEEVFCGHGLYRYGIITILVLILRAWLYIGGSVIRCSPRITLRTLWALSVRIETISIEEKAMYNLI